MFRQLKAKLHSEKQKKKKNTALKSAVIKGINDDKTENDHKKQFDEISLVLFLLQRVLRIDLLSLNGE